MIDIQESELVNGWNTNESIKVSVCCLTFNHEDYIEKALDSFLGQKTCFPFEIIIHDDASTDKTSSILLKYKRAFPNIVKIIIQKNNQQSIGIKVTKEFLWKEAIGEYIALCDGDDYWSDNNKLQKQYNALVINSNKDICFHDYEILANNRIKDNKRVFGSSLDKNKIVSVNSVIVGGGGYMLTSSILIRSSILKNLPDWFDTVINGDYFLQVLGSINNAVYLHEKMAVYRELSKGSWTERFKNKNGEELKIFYSQSDKSMVLLRNHLPKKFAIVINYRRFLLNLSGIKNSVRAGAFKTSFYFIFKAMASILNLYK